MHHSLTFLLRIVYAAVFAAVLLLHSSEIIHYVPELLGGLLILESVSQIFELTVLKFRTQVHYGFYLAPALILLFGLYMTFFCEMPELKFFTTSIEDLSSLTLFKIKMKMAGLGFLCFIIEEIVVSIVFFKPLYRPEKFAEEQRALEEAKKQLEASQSQTPSHDIDPKE